jgi:hypothetical protein
MYICIENLEATYDFSAVFNIFGDDFVDELGQENPRWIVNLRHGGKENFAYKILFPSKPYINLDDLSIAHEISDVIIGDR